VHLREPLGDELRLDSERLGHGYGRDRRLRGELFVPELDRPLRHGSGCCDVPTPGPRRPRRIRDRAELVAALGLDPEPRMRPVGEARVVGPGPLRVQPAALEQRGGDVTAVPDDVDGDRLRVCAQCCREHEARLRRLLHSAQPPREREPTDPLQDRAQSV
jgi:hypothetical protein